MVVNKIDIMKPEELDPATKESLDALIKPGEVEMLRVSCMTAEGKLFIFIILLSGLSPEKGSQK